MLLKRPSWKCLPQSLVRRKGHAGRATRIMLARQHGSSSSSSSMLLVPCLSSFTDQILFSPSLQESCWGLLGSMCSLQFVLLSGRGFSCRLSRTKLMARVGRILLMTDEHVRTIHSHAYQNLLVMQPRLAFAWPQR